MPMNRTRKAYEVKFGALLGRARARRIEQGWRWFLAVAERLSEREGVLPARALTQVYQAALRKREHWPEAFVPARLTEPVSFLCDAGLGGLARWLRAAGYEAEWSPDTTDDELAREENRPGVVVLTTDSLLMEQRVLRDGVVPAVWVPPSLKPREQMRLIFDELRLPQRESLCMNCGGRLRPVDKESVQERIPPRTRLWLDAYFLCERCGQLFWYGTHWERIQRRLQQCLTND